MYKPIEEKIKAFEQKNFGEVSTEFDLKSEKIMKMYDKFIGKNHRDSSKMFDFIRAELLELIQMRKQYCKDKKEEIKTQRSKKQNNAQATAVFRIGAQQSSMQKKDQVTALNMI